MQVYSDAIETVTEGIVLELTREEASLLRRAVYFNKTIGKRVAEKDGADAGDTIKEFLGDLGDYLADEGIERWSGC